MHNLSNEYFQHEYETGMNEYANELLPEYESEGEYNGETAYELHPEFTMESEQYEMNEHELAQELMEINNEAEFGAWLKKVGKKVAGGAARFLDSPIGTQATAALGDIAQKTLPGLGGKAGAWAGRKIGGLFGKGDAGSQLGQRLGTQAGTAAADRYPDFVRFATDALGNMSQEYETGATPAVKPAIVAAAKRHYPIILQVRVSIDRKPMNNESEYNHEFYGETNYESESEIMNSEGSFNEVTEMELASELLSVQSESELDRFIGKLFKKAAGGGGQNPAQGGTRKNWGGILKGIAKKALPFVGKALGTFIPIPGVGTAIGGMIGKAASNLFELELEGLSAEDREFEMARAFVRFAGNSAKRVALSRGMNPSLAARTAIMGAARGYAPGLLVRRPMRGYGGGCNCGNSYRNVRNVDIDDAVEGTWRRVDGRIVLTANQ